MSIRQLLLDFQLISLIHDLFCSIAGLWTARICANHFDDVLVIEPESWLGTSEGRTNVYDENGTPMKEHRVHTRSRVPQYNAIHGR